MTTFVKYRSKQVTSLLSLFLMKAAQWFEQTFLVFSLGERGETGAFWVDLSNVDDRSAFKFSNGGIPEDYFWAEDKPSPHDDPTFVVVNVSDHGNWDNVDGKEKHSFICEHQRFGVERSKPHVMSFRADISAAPKEEGEASSYLKILQIRIVNRLESGAI
ncbi:hypothetical protein CAPTEDRAFT_190642 [Capitella teleta]|uniref:C-type lectin domain-containing protein n=1 Tax=Capitella teleta TaxID=283909 RepID=R7TAZ3_CAPTE|nr:hypothetical protein CAPTEDRAFT_190642 [Capitella teleta]|eukprot:ELT90898.1 hypothetical protein CAPTEDRAFT_190642 [Capitella teleta]